MDLDSTDLDLSSERVVEDLSDLVESIYNDQVLFPDSPPDSGSEHLLSPANSNNGRQQQHQQQHHVPQHMASSSNSPVHPQGGHSNNNNSSNSHHTNYFHESETYQNTVPLTSASPTYSQLGPATSVTSFVGQNLHLYRPFPDLSTIDYSVPLQLIEQHQRQQQQQQQQQQLQQHTSLHTLVNLEPSRVILPRICDRGSAVRYSEVSVQPELEVEVERYKKRKFTYEQHQQQPVAKRLSPGHADIESNQVKSEVCLSPDHLLSPSLSPQSSSCAASLSGAMTSSNNSRDHGTINNNIKFTPLLPQKWCKMYDSSLKELPTPKLVVVADKGFNFSTIDDSFIVQKKNHFQLTCHMTIRSGIHFVHTQEGEIGEVKGLRLNFYGVKSEAQYATIKIEQSQADRSKRVFHPMILDLGKSGKTVNSGMIRTEPVPGTVDGEEELKIAVGRLHFAETTSNNMRKKGKPNPAQKYFQLVVSLEAMVDTGNGKHRELDLIRLASEKIIVRASNPGQFESDTEVAWCREPSSDTIYHMGKVGINCDQSTEALTVHGNLQVTGQILQPSDIRIKNVMKELNSREQLEKVKQIKIFQYKYKPEFVSSSTEDQRLANRSQTGVIAQEIQKILPDAVSSSGPYLLNNGELIDDMLIVDKDRLFLENIGAVHELSNITCNLGDRIDDLEKANENVAVRLSRLKRVSSVSPSSCSGDSIAALKAKHTERQNGRENISLFHNRCVQSLLIALVVIIAISLVSIAVVYIFDFQKRSSNNNSNNEDNKYYDRRNNNNVNESFPFTTTTTTTSTMYPDMTNPLPSEPDEVITLPVSMTQNRESTRWSWLNPGSTAPWIPGDTSTSSQITSGMYQFNTPVIGALLPTEENSCRTLTYARCRSFCCRTEPDATGTSTSESPGNPRLSDPYGLTSNFYRPNLNQALFVENENLPLVVTPATSTTTTSPSSNTADEDNSNNQTILQLSSSDAPMVYDVAPVPEITTSRTKITAGLNYQQDDIDNEQDKAQTKEVFSRHTESQPEDVKPEVKLEEQRLRESMHGADVIQQVSGKGESDKGKLQDITEDKKINKLKDDRIEHFSSSNETVNEVEEREVFEEVDKTDSVYFDMNQEMLYFNMSRGNSSSDKRKNESLGNSASDNSDYSKMYSHQNVSDMIARQGDALGALNEIEDTMEQGNQPAATDLPAAGSFSELKMMPSQFARAKRSASDIQYFKGYFARPAVRRVRDTGNEQHVVIRETGNSHQVNHHVEIKDTDVQQSSSTTANTPTDLSEIRWPILVTASYGNFSLDHRFCNPDLKTNYLACVTGSWENASMSVPLSRHFSDRTVSLIFPQNVAARVAICASENNGYHCSTPQVSENNWHAASFIGAGTDGLFVVDVSQSQRVDIRLRLILDPSLNMQTVCGVSPRRLGTMFKEYNLQLLRMCEM